MIKFIYTTEKYDKRKESIVSKVCEQTKKFISLPPTIEVEFKNMNNSVYAETILDFRIPNRIRLNSSISYNEIIKPTLHELIHLNQLYTGKLTFKNNKIILWENKVYKIDNSSMTYEEYQNLPWELDVKFKEKKLLNQILNS